MYEIKFETFSFAEVPSIEEALSLSLALHNASSKPHTIGVIAPDGKCVITLSKPQAMAEITQVSASPNMDVVMSPSGRRSAGIGRNYVDAYNEAQIAKYNNDYNYWLWQQQAQYNDPVAQVARLRNAGLNPNFNAIDGTGNLNSIPSSSASMTPSIRSNQLKTAGTMFDGLNEVVGAIGTTLDNMSKLTSLPADKNEWNLIHSAMVKSPYYKSISDRERAFYDQLLTSVMAWKFSGDNKDSDVKDLNTLLGELRNLGWGEIGSGLSNYITSDSPFVKEFNSIVGKNEGVTDRYGVLNELSKFLKENYYPSIIDLNDVRRRQGEKGITQSNITILNDLLKAAVQLLKIVL